MAYQGEVAEMMISVCILFHEKPDQTIECVGSFLPSGCPIYVLNNASSIAAREQFTAWCADFPQVRLLDAPQNLGVSGGRNVLIRETGEDWLFFVDNDIVVKTPDWLERVARHVAQGPEVLIPRLFNRHQGRYVEYRRIEIVESRAQFAPLVGSATNSFPGGAALVNRSLFKRLGYYDESMFVGGEDFELALRGVLTDKPIRAHLVPDVELIHDHRPAHGHSDVQAVLIRYDKERIRQSYERIREKHGIIMLDGWEGWVDRQVRQQINHAARVSQNETDGAGSRPRIALVSDVRDWAFHNIAVSIQKYLGDSYDFDIFYLNEYFPDLGSAARDLFTASYDLIHFLSRQGLPLLFNHLLRRKEGVTDEVLAGFIDTPFSFSIYSHCQLSTADLDHLRLVFNYLAKGYTVSSVRLDGIYRSLENFAPPTMVIEDGVDPGLFYAHGLERLTEKNRQLVIGWAGNSNWGRHVDGQDHKGLHTLVKPTIDSLQREGLPVVGHFSDSSEGHTPHQEMVNYYNALDIYVCASDLEGTPNPVLEAMACGLPIVSTDVGIVPELFGPLQQDFIVRERSVAAIQDKVRLLVTDPALRQALSNENLERIAEWTREAESQKWQSFFAMVLGGDKGNGGPDNSAMPGGQTLKRLCLDFPYNFMFAEAVNDYLADSLSWKITAPLRKVHYYFNQWIQKYQQRKACRKSGGDTSGQQ